MYESHTYLLYKDTRLESLKTRGISPCAMRVGTQDLHDQLHNQLAFTQIREEGLMQAERERGWRKKTYLTNASTVLQDYFRPTLLNEDKAVEK